MMEIHQQFLTNNDCYKAGTPIKPKGVMVHSTGANNKYISRYVQPDDGILGYNRNQNDWNHPNIQKCVHGFIGLDKNGNVAIYQTLPWTIKGWHCGADANMTHISFEICEDNLTDPVYFDKVYKAAVELTARLCMQFGFNPMQDGVVICHCEGYERGIASGHSDVMHWFPKFGKNMNTFRRDVKLKIDTKEEWVDMTKQETIDLFNEMFEKKFPVYKTIDDVPVYYQDAINKLKSMPDVHDTTKTVLRGTADGVLNVSEDVCKIATFMDRAGVI